MRSRAFTLLELLVVIAILIILIAVSVPTVRALTKGNHQTQAVNLLTSLLAHARATAVVTHRPTGVVVYEYPISNFTASTSYLQLVTQLSTEGRLRYFGRVPGSGPQRLPQGIQVATLDDNGRFKKSNDLPTGKSRIVLFDSSGQMVMVNGIGTHFSLLGEQEALAWNLNATNDNNLSIGVSSPGLVVYDADEYIQSQSSSHPVAPDVWLRNHATILIVNPYTGSILR
jgi:prepilin-type N-terminal cleavage/methylation domain-containing protein